MKKITIDKWDWFNTCSMRERIEYLFEVDYTEISMNDYNVFVNKIHTHFKRIENYDTNFDFKEITLGEFIDFQNHFNEKRKKEIYDMYWKDDEYIIDKYFQIEREWIDFNKFLSKKFKLIFSKEDDKDIKISDDMNERELREYKKVLRERELYQKNAWLFTVHKLSTNILDIPKIYELKALDVFLYLEMEMFLNK